MQNLIKHGKVQITRNAYCEDPVFVVREERISEATTTEAIEQGVINCAHGNLVSIIGVVANVCIHLSR